MAAKKVGAWTQLNGTAGVAANGGDAASNRPRDILSHMSPWSMKLARFHHSGIRRSRAALVVAGMVAVATLAVGCGDDDPLAFKDVASSAGLTHIQSELRYPPDCLFNDLISDSEGCELERISGAVAVGDANGDGLDDLYFTRLDGPGLLYRNNGDATFTDVTESSGLANLDFRSNGAGWADLDNDGHQDLVVTTFKGNRYYLFMNNGDGTFSEQAIERGTAVADTGQRSGFGVAFGDIDNDGYTDIHLTEWMSAGGQTIESASHTRLLRNRGASQPGYFDNVTESAGVELGLTVRDTTGTSQVTTPNYSFASALTDLDGDGWVDLIVAGDFGTTQLFWNDGDGTFTEGTDSSGIGFTGNAMGLAVADMDGNGFQDVFITAIAGRADFCQGRPCPIEQTGNRLFRNNGDRTFTEIQQEAGVTDGAWGWGAAAFDANNNGLLDLVMTNGVQFDANESYIPLIGPFRNTPKRLWLNRGNGTFGEVATQVGIDVEIPGTGLAVFDMNGDGHLEVIMVHPLASPSLWQNNATSDNHWLRIAVEGTTSNRDGLGAVVEVVRRAGEPAIIRHVGTNSHFQGQSERTVHVGLGPDAGLDNGSVHRVRVLFPATGREVVMDNVMTKQELRITEPAS